MEKHKTKKKRIIIIATIFIAFFFVNVGFAETVSIVNVTPSLQTFIDRSDFSGWITDTPSGKISVSLSFYGKTIEMLYCPQKYESGTVKKAVERMAKYINAHIHIDVFEMLSDAGLPGCKDHE